MELGAMTFAAPWVLAALVTLPVIWWLLRVNPPAPKRIGFPAIRFLLNLPRHEETPSKTPLWLMILRLLLAALIIVALAHPLLNPSQALKGSGPLVMVVDDGWAAAPHWEARITAMQGLLDRADRADRPAMIVTTAPTGEASGVDVMTTELLRVSEARDVVRALSPKPWSVDRVAATAAVEGLEIEGTANVVWLSDGLVAKTRRPPESAENSDNTVSPAEAAADLARALQRLGPLTVIEDTPGETAHLLLSPRTEGSVWDARVRRAGSGEAAPIAVRLVGADGRLLARERMVFDADAPEGSVRFDLPAELINETTRVEIEGEQGAGAVFLIDDRWGRRPVGLVSGGGVETAQPLLGELYYVRNALEPFAEIRDGNLLSLLERELSVLVLADVGSLVGAERDRVGNWLQNGGVLIRFAGPRLADAADDLVPVALRVGGSRSLGGALSWEQPMPLAPFDERSPFYGLALPEEVVVERQVLAEPALDIGEKTWARLDDGTPLVTAERRGEGWIILFHTTANTRWSNLALSGLFVDMLRRIVEMSEGIAGADSDAPLAAQQVLDGFGRLTPPSPNTSPIAANRLAEVVPGPGQPPGLYGSSTYRRAINLSPSIDTIEPLPALPSGIARTTYETPDEVDLMPWLLAIAALIALIDIGISLWLRGLFPGRAAGAAATGALVFLCVAALIPRSGLAQDGGDEGTAVASANETRLAYYVTGNPEFDRASRAGLFGLGMILYRRTAIEPGPPAGIDPETDEIIFYPLIYWPVTQDQAPLSDAALHKLDRYLKAGGLVLFDTRDQAPQDRIERVFDRPGGSRLAAVLRGLDLPPLIPVPQDHALTRTFYLLDEFPGRWAGGEVWVERQEDGSNDGVSSVVIGGNDWAGAWALDDRFAPLFPVVPGGERQREMAFRFGVNLVMYALTGNYKTDQVHLPIILERLGLRDRDPESLEEIE